jgi:CRISPR-associated protein Cas2
MYIILVYDAAPRRGVKLLKFLRKKLHWVQNSVFEGEVTDSSFSEIQREIGKIINEEEDSIIFYTFDSKNYFDRGILGKERNDTDTFI